MLDEIRELYGRIKELHSFSEIISEKADTLEIGEGGDKKEHEKLVNLAYIMERQLNNLADLTAIFEEKALYMKN